MQPGTYYDNIYIGGSEAEAKRLAKEGFGPKKLAEADGKREEEEKMQAAMDRFYVQEEGENYPKHIRLYLNAKAFYVWKERRKVGSVRSMRNVSFIVA